jgi:uncharacterized protein YacL (UPF0231 family)
VIVTSRSYALDIDIDIDIERDIDYYNKYSLAAVGELFV